MQSTEHTSRSHQTVVVKCAAHEIIASIKGQLEKQRQQATKDPEIVDGFEDFRATIATKRETLDYRIGHDNGAQDGMIVCQPPGTNGHTPDEYLRIRDWYEISVDTLEPTAWQLGYGEGFDEIVEKMLPRGLVEGDLL